MIYVIFFLPFLLCPGILREFLLLPWLRSLPLLLLLFPHLAPGVGLGQIKIEKISIVYWEVHVKHVYHILLETIKRKNNL